MSKFSERLATNVATGTVVGGTVGLVTVSPVLPDQRNPGAVTTAAGMAVAVPAMATGAAIGAAAGAAKTVVDGFFDH